MSLYLGNDGKRKVILNGVIYNFKVFYTKHIANEIRLLSSDNYILKDSNGIYLTAKESE